MGNILNPRARMLLKVSDLKPEEVKAVVDSVSIRHFAGNIYARRRGIDKVQLFVKDERGPGALVLYEMINLPSKPDAAITARLPLVCCSGARAVVRRLIYNVGVKKVEILPYGAIKADKPIKVTFWDWGAIGDFDKWTVQHKRKMKNGCNFPYRRWCICNFIDYETRKAASPDWPVHTDWPKAQLTIALGGKKNGKS